MGALLPVLEELGTKAAGTSYAAAAILALLLAPDRETAFVYLFFGWYPILRPRIAALPLPAFAPCGPAGGVQCYSPAALWPGPAAYGPDGGAAGVRLVL